MSAGQITENLCAKASHTLAPIVYNPHFTHVITNAPDVTRQAHALGNVVTETPEIDNIATGAQRRCTLDQRRLEPCRFQPKRQCWSTDTNSRDEQGLTIHMRTASTSRASTVRSAYRIEGMTTRKIAMKTRQGYIVWSFSSQSWP